MVRRLPGAGFSKESALARGERKMRGRRSRRAEIRWKKERCFMGWLLSSGASYATFRGYIYTTLKLEKLQENCCGSGAVSDEAAPDLGVG